MVFRKARRFRKKRTTYKKKFAKRFLRKRIQNDKHYFKGHAEHGNIVVTAGETKFFAETFKLANLTNVASFSQLYDHYRINAVKITFYPPFNVYNASGTGALNVPEIYLVRDYDTSVDPTSIAQLDQYTHTVRRAFTRPVSMFLKPKVTMPVYGESGNAFCNPARPPWIDMAKTDVVYYGILGGITCSQTSLLPAMTIRVTADYYISCKNVR